jgi:hypothetical protein
VQILVIIINLLLYFEMTKRNPEDLFYFVSHWVHPRVLYIFLNLILLCILLALYEVNIKFQRL